jgi:PKD repeat protein
MKTSRTLALAGAGLLMAAGLLATPGIAAADTSQPLCTNTTYVDGSTNKTKSTNYGGNVDLNMAGTVRFAYLECVVSGLPAGATVTGATLDVFSRSPNTAHTVRLHNQPTAWTENTVTWNSLHTYDAAVLSSAPGDLVPGSGEWVSLPAPVTGNGTYRWALDVSTTGLQAYASDDYTTDTTRRPRMTITWSAAVVAPVASFTANPASGQAPLTVQFTDTSTNTPTSWAWDFGDGGTSTAQSPSHTYAAAGTFTVSLTAANAGGSDVSDPQTITVDSPPPPPTWTTLASYDFTDGAFPAAFYAYDTRLASGICTRSSHATVVNGALELKLSYEASGSGYGSPSCGAEWYAGTVAARSAYGGSDIAIEFDAQLVPSGVTNVGSHQNWAMGWKASANPLPWYQTEQDFCEGRLLNYCQTYLHYQDGSPCCIDGPGYTYDKTAWHHWRFESLSTTHQVRVYLDGNLVWDYQGDATTVTTGARIWILQQECASDTSSYVCPSGTVGTVLQRYDNIVLQRLAVA